MEKRQFTREFKLEAVRSWHQPDMPGWPDDVGSCG
jgi:hypothetical protein